MVILPRLNKGAKSQTANFLNATQLLYICLVLDWNSQKTRSNLQRSQFISGCKIVFKTCSCQTGSSVGIPLCHTLYTRSRIYNINNVNKMPDKLGHSANWNDVSVMQSVTEN